MKNKAEKFAELMQDRRARRGVEKRAPQLLAQYDALVKNGAAEMMRAVYLGGLSDCVMQSVADGDFDADVSGTMASLKDILKGKA